MLKKKKKEDGDHFLPLTISLQHSQAQLPSNSPRLLGFVCRKEKNK
jgi:hypothetical protein